MLRHGRTTASISLLALALAGCNKSAPDMSATTANSAASADSSASGLPALPAALPMQTGPAASLNTAPPVSALPVRRAVSVARPANGREAYAYLDRASDIEDEIGDAPPDYDYHDEGGVSPYVWQTNGGDYRYAEPVEGGGYRYYYYQPGAQYPYLVRTHDYSYAYAGAALVAVYALSGALVPPDRYGGYRDQASRYFSRGQQLRQSSAQQEHQGVNAANWAAQRAQFSAAQANWAADRARQADWQAYHAQNDPSQRPGWQHEHQQRQQVAQQFSGWQSHGFSGSPPPALAAGGARAAGPDANHRPGPTTAPGEHVPGSPGPQGFAAQRGSQGGPMSGHNPNDAGQANAAHEQQLAAQRPARHHDDGPPPAPTPPEAAAKQQMIANVHRQEDAAAQQELAGRRQAQQHEAQTAHEAQLHALAVEHQQVRAPGRETRDVTEPMAHAHPQLTPALREHAMDAQRPSPAPRPAEARTAPPEHVDVQRHSPAPRPAEARPPAAHPEGSRVEQAHTMPGRGEPGREHEHDQ